MALLLMPVISQAGPYEKEVNDFCRAHEKVVIEILDMKDEGVSRRAALGIVGIASPKGRLPYKEFNLGAVNRIYNDNYGVSGNLERRLALKKELQYCKNNIVTFIRLHLRGR